MVLTSALFAVAAFSGCGPAGGGRGATPANGSAAPSSTAADSTSCQHVATYPDIVEWRDDPQQTLGDIVTCEFRGAAYASYSEDQQHGTFAPMIQLRPNEVLRLTFAGLASDAPVVKGNLGEAKLTVTKRDEKELVLLEQTPNGIPVVYVISRVTRAAIWSKAYARDDGRPLGFVTVGRCY